MLYCNKAPPGVAKSLSLQWGFMPTHVHEHVTRTRIITTITRQAGAIRRPRSSPSILRMALIERLAAAAVMIAVIWGAVFWAMFVTGMR